MSEQTPISVFPWWPNLSAWVGIDPEALTHRIIEVLLREENNLIQVTEDNELYVDLQLPNWVAPTDDFPVGVTTWSVQAVDGRPYTGTLLHYETTSWDYCQWLRGNNGNLYFDGWDGTRKQVYYADQILALLDEYIRRRDFYWNAEVITNGTITLWLSTTVTPNANFQVLPPSEVKDGQTYILRVNNEATVYNMSLSPLIYNPHTVDLTLTPNMIDMFVFLCVNGSLELQPLYNGLRSMFKTQDEYDALPASKTTDGNLYIIVDTHIHFMPFAELIELTPAPDAILTELNKDGKGYAEYYYENRDIEFIETPSSQLPRADAYAKMYEFSEGNYAYYLIDTNLTEQELINIWQFTQEQIEAILAWEWFAHEQERPPINNM